jgi:hypothetical protein
VGALPSSLKEAVRSVASLAAMRSSGPNLATGFVSDDGLSVSHFQRAWLLAAKVSALVSHFQSTFRYSNYARVFRHFSILNSSHARWTLVSLWTEE